MANDEYNRASGAQQPGLRSFIIYNELPQSCFAFEVEGRCSEPHIRDAEFAVIDPTDREPMHGELFLFQFDSRRRCIVELGSQDMVTSEGEAMLAWTAYWQMEMVTACGTARQIRRWSDGPYREAGIAPKLLGRVVGIFEPDFRNILRPIA